MIQVLKTSDEFIEKFANVVCYDHEGMYQYDSISFGYVNEGGHVDKYLMFKRNYLSVTANLYHEKTSFRSDAVHLAKAMICALIMDEVRTFHDIATFIVNIEIAKRVTLSVDNGRHEGNELFLKLANLHPQITYYFDDESVRITGFKDCKLLQVHVDTQIGCKNYEYVAQKVQQYESATHLIYDPNKLNTIASNDPLDTILRLARQYK